MPDYTMPAVPANARQRHYFRYKVMPLGSPIFRHDAAARAEIYRNAGIVARGRKGMVLQELGTQWSAFFAARNPVRDAHVLAEQAQGGDG
jgi:hypothetical protein